jgi:hypothetical protein
MRERFNRNYVSLVLLSLLAFTFVVLRFATGGPTVIDIPESYTVESVEGRSWVKSNSKGVEWVLLTSPRLLGSNSLVKTEKGGVVKLNFVELGELRLSSSSYVSVRDVGDSVAVDLSKGRAWVNYSGGGDGFSVDVKEVSVNANEGSSFWIDASDDSFIEVGSVVGDLDVVALNKGLRYFSDSVVGGDVVRFGEEKSVDFDKLTSKEMRSDWIIGEVNNDLAKILSETGVEDKKVVELRKTLKGEFKAPIIKPVPGKVVEVVELGEGEKVELDTPSELSLSVNDVLKFGGGVEGGVSISGSVGDEVVVDKSGDGLVFGKGKLDETPMNILVADKIAAGMKIKEADFKGAKPLIAKWYYEEQVSAGPVFIELKTVDKPGNYVFEFPVHAKPSFLRGDDWPKGRYFVKIYYSGDLVNEHYVTR